MSERRMLKYPLFNMSDPAVGDEITLDLPWPTNSQHLAMQGTWITLWAIAGEMLPVCTRRFRVLGTGHVIRGDMNYVGTVQDRQFVWHVFEDYPQ
jgi:hypothetical protein